jgi:hypothetical protein
MKQKLTILFLFFAFFLPKFSSHAAEIILKGVYQGKNLYVQNPLVPGQTRYCTLNVYVNGTMLLTDPRSSSYEIDLSRFSLNTPVEVRIVHSPECKPKIINPSVIKALGKFQFVGVSVDASLIRWNSVGETASSIYYVERYINNNWITLKIITAQKTGNNTYAIEVRHNTGNNRYRVKHQELDGQFYYTQSVDFQNIIYRAKFYPKNVMNKIYFTADVNYEIFDIKKTLVKRGRGREIDASALKRGVYYLVFDSQTEQFLKK